MKPRKGGGISVLVGTGLSGWVLIPTLAAALAGAPFHPALALAAPSLSAGESRNAQGVRQRLGHRDQGCSCSREGCRHRSSYRVAPWLNGEAAHMAAIGLKKTRNSGIIITSNSYNCREDSWLRFHDSHLPGWLFHIVRPSWALRGVCHEAAGLLLECKQFLTKTRSGRWFCEFGDHTSAAWEYFGTRRDLLSFHCC